MVMPMLSSRSLFRAAFIAASLAISSIGAPALAHGAPASAEEVEYRDYCAVSVQTKQWTPQKGPVARFVVDTFLASGATGIWIGLGRSGTSFWSAEGGDMNDACDDCRVLRLVETRADGTRKQYDIWNHDIGNQVGTDPAAQKAHMLAALWKLSGTTWPTDKLTQDYSMTLGRPGASTASTKQTFAVAIQSKNTLNLRYDFEVSKLMCWCVFDWKSQNGR